MVIVDLLPRARAVSAVLGSGGAATRGASRSQYPNATGLGTKHLVILASTSQRRTALRERRKLPPELGQGAVTDNDGASTKPPRRIASQAHMVDGLDAGAASTAYSGHARHDLATPIFRF